MKLFKFYIPDNLPSNKSQYCHFGWEGNGYWAWSSVLMGYMNALDAIYEKYKSSIGDFSVIDTLVYPLCFVSRQIIELSIKYLYLKFSAATDEVNKTFFNNNHDLYREWQLLKPILSEAKRKVTTKVSVGDIEDYVLQMNKFDQTSMRMRYPVDKNLNASNKKAQWLDIPVLYKGMKHYYDLIIQLTYDLDRKVSLSDDDQAMRRFISVYMQKRYKINDFLTALSKVNESEEFEEHLISNVAADKISDEQKAWKLYFDFDDDTKIVTECLFYAGRAVLYDVNLPKANSKKICAVISLCIEQMHSDHMEFGKKLEDWQTNIYGKMSSSIVTNCSAAMEYLEQINMKAL